MFPTVKFTNNRGFTAAEWAALAIERIMSIDTASVPPPVVAQAEAYREQIRATIEHYIQHAVNERRAIDATVADQAGQPDIAAAIRDAI